MKVVLIVEDEPALLESLQEGLSMALPDYQFHSAASVEAAESLLHNGIVPSLIISDIRLPGKSGVEFVVDLRQRRPGIRFILMSAFPSTVPEHLIASSSGVQFQRKPFRLADLVSRIQKTLKGPAFTGDIQGITLIDLLQILEMGRRTAALEIRNEGQVGTMYVVEGELVHAEVDGTEGVEAFNAMIAWQRGSYSVKSDVAAPGRTIDDALSFLLLEFARLSDEAEHAEATSLAATESSVEEENMSDVKELCKNLVEEAPNAVAASVIDLSTGAMIIGHFLSDFTSDHFEAVSGAATNLFRGKETLWVEELVQAQRGDASDEHYVEEVYLATTHRHLFMIKLPDREVLLCLVTKKPGNVGMGWSAIRATVAKLVRLLAS